RAGVEFRRGHAIVGKPGLRDSVLAMNVIGAGENIDTIGWLPKKLAAQVVGVDSSGGLAVQVVREVPANVIVVRREASGEGIADERPADEGGSAVMSGVVTGAATDETAGQIHAA